MDRLNKAAAVSLVLFSVVLAAFVGSRIDQVTLALLGGTFIGLLVAIPSVLLAVVLALRRRDDSGRAPYERPHVVHMPSSPPPYWVVPTPTDLPHDARGMAYPVLPMRAPTAAEYVLPPTRRRFYLIGESGEVQEIEAPTDLDRRDDPI